MRRACRGNPKAVLLLEVVVALAVLVTAMTYLGAELVAGLKMTGIAEEQTRANQLGDRVVAMLELDVETVEQFFEQQEIDGDFGEAYPGWFWRAWLTELTDEETMLDETDFEDEEQTPQIGRVTVRILRQEDPNDGEDIESARVVREIHLLKANPGRINLVEDFGLDPNQVAQFADLIPIEGLDPTALDPQLLVSLDPEMLMQLIPMILPLIEQFRAGGQSGNISPDMLANLLQGGANPQDIFNQLAGADRGGAGGDDELASVRELLRERLGSELSEEQLEQLVTGGQTGGRGGQNQWEPRPGADPRGGFGDGPVEGPRNEGGGRRGGARGGRGGAQTIEDFQEQRNQRQGGRGGRGGRAGGAPIGGKR